MRNKLLPSSFSGLLLILLGVFFSVQAFAFQNFPPPDKMTFPRLEFHIPQAEKILLENGMVLFFLEDRELPLISISAMLYSGSMCDPPGKEGLAELTASVMRTGGTSKLSSSEVDRRLDFLAASPSISMSLDAASVHFSFLKTDLAHCMDLLSQMIRTPAFEQEKLDLAISLQQEDLRRIADHPQRLAFREFNRLLYPNDPRGRYVTSDSLKKIDRSDLIRFHEDFFYPANMLFSVSGNLSREEAIRMMNQYFGDWQSDRRRRTIAPAPKETGHGVFLIQKPLPQSTVITGHMTVSKKDNDYYAFSLLDFIIGSGGFNSRIFSAVRNNEGLAYSAGSFYRARPTYGVFGAYAFTKTESTAQALHLINAIFKDVASGSITQNELDWSKKSTVNSFLFSFEKPENVVSLQMTMDFENLSADFLSGYRERIEKTTREDLRRAGARHLKGKKTLTVIVGDADRFGHLPETVMQPVLISPKP